MDTWEERVKLFARQARDKAGNAEALTELLESAGIRSNRTGKRLRPNTITQWMRGIAVPPGDTLLAMASVTKLSLDALLRPGFDARGVPSLGEVENRLAESERDLQQALGQLGELRLVVSEIQHQVDRGDLAERIAGLEAAEAEFRTLISQQRAKRATDRRSKVAG